MNKKIIFALIFGLAVIYGCASSQLNFKEGAKKITEMEMKYGASVKVPPATTPEIDDLMAQIMGFSVANQLPDSLELFIEFKLKFLEAEKLNAEGWQWGKGSTTDYGFGCKNGYLRITESARIRNVSAQKGYEAVSILQEFVDTYSKEAKSLNLTQKDVLVLNAVYFQNEEKASRDAKIIKSACKEQANATKQHGA